MSPPSSQISNSGSYGQCESSGGAFSRAENIPDYSSTSYAVAATSGAPHRSVDNHPAVGGRLAVPPAFPLVTTRVGQALPLRRAGSKKTNERTGNVDENKGRLSTADSQLEDLGHGAALVLCSLNPKPRSQCPLSWHEPASLPIPSPPWGRGWTATAFSSAAAGRVRGWFRSTQTFLLSFL